MKLSAAYILHELRKKISLRMPPCPDLLPVLEPPVILTNTVTPKESGIWIFDKDMEVPRDLRFAKEALLFFIKGCPPPSNLPENSCIVLTDDTDLVTLYNLIQSIFNTITNWQEEIMESRLNRESIQQLLDISSPVFHNSMMVIGLDFTIVASALLSRRFQDEIVFGSSENTFQYVIDLKKDELYNSVRDKDGYFYYPNKVTGIASLCVNIKKFNKTTHRLMVLGDLNPISPCYGFLLEMLARMVEHAFSYNAMQRSSKDLTLHSIIRSFLSERTADYVTVSQKLDAMGWYSRHQYDCIVLQMTYMDQENMTAKAICSYMENIIPHSCAMVFQDTIVIYVNFTLADAQLNGSSVSDKIIYFIRDSLMKAGYSRRMVGHLNLRRQYDQARIALSLGNRKNPSQWIHRFNEISLDYILEQATRKLPGYMVSHENLLLLKTMDENNDTDYMHTLELYLDNHLNAVKTARELFIHRSTFLYRLDKIKDVLKVDFDNPDDVLYLMLSFRFIHLEETSPEHF